MMNQMVRLVAVAAVLAGLVFAGASCNEIRKQVADKVAKEATKQMVSPEGCDAAMAQNMTAEDEEAFKQKLDVILEEVKTAEDPIAAFDGKKDAFRALFDEYVNMHGLDSKCTDMLNDKFMNDTKEQLEMAL